MSRSFLALMGLVGLLAGCSPTYSSAGGTETGDSTVPGGDSDAPVDSKPTGDSDSGASRVDSDGDGYAVEDGDCDDGNPAINPGAQEVPDNAVDEDCDGEVGTTPVDTGPSYTDNDGDGYGAEWGDCNDGNAAINPGAIEVCDTVDNNCDGQTDEDLAKTWYSDADGDGYGNPSGSTVSSCLAQAGYADNAEDCDDYAGAINPGAQEVLDNAVDEDCDGVVGTTSVDTGSDDTGSVDTGPSYTDSDSDGYGAEYGDCDDNNASVNPGAAEIANDGVDQDCDGVDLVTETDADGDGYGVSTDCDDTNASVNPGATEICDAIDNDCNGDADSELSRIWYADADGDGYGDTTSNWLGCAAAAGFVSDNTDCDDADAGTNPGAAESANDGIDQNCDGVDLVTETDADGDGYGVNSDCDDSDADVNPGAAESCDGLDNDCDGQADDGLAQTWYSDADGDGYGNPSGTVVSSCSAQAGYADKAEDCDDQDDTVYPGAAETVEDGIDQDCDGTDLTLVDLEDQAVCDDPNQEACFQDLDGDGAYETLVMDGWQLYGVPDIAYVYENGFGTGCQIDGEEVFLNDLDYYVMSFVGLPSCTSQVSVVDDPDVTKANWWQNYSFCTDGSDAQGICVNTGGYNYLFSITWDDSAGLIF